MRPLDILVILALQETPSSSAESASISCSGDLKRCDDATRRQNGVVNSDNSMWLTIVSQMYAITKYVLTPVQAKSMFCKVLTEEYGNDMVKMRNDYDNKLSSCSSTLLSVLLHYIRCETKSSVSLAGTYKDALTPHVNRSNYSTTDALPLFDSTDTRGMTGGHDDQKHTGDTAAVDRTPMQNSVSSVSTKTHSTTAVSDGHLSVAAANTRLGVSTLDKLSNTSITAPSANRMSTWIQSLDARQRVWVNNLRYNTPLRADVLRGLLQQFFCVENSDVFFAPVPAATIMEFNGIRLSSYNNVIRAPMSLLVINKLIGESWRRFRNSNFADHASFLARPNTPLRTSGTHNGQTSDDGFCAQSFEQSMCSSSANSDCDVGSADGNYTYDIESASALHLSDFSFVHRIITLAELERSLWLIAANCVMFNAPETSYPDTARRFAAACTNIIVDYCQRELHGFEPKT